MNFIFWKLKKPQKIWISIFFYKLIFSHIFSMFLKTSLFRGDFNYTRHGIMFLFLSYCIELLIFIFKFPVILAGDFNQPSNTVLRKINPSSWSGVVSGDLASCCAKDTNFIFFCKLKKPQRTWISFFASLKNVKKHEFHFLQA